MDTNKSTLQTILQLGYAAYERSHVLPDHVRRAVWAILACRTALLGGHVQACPEGHVERIWSTSCRHRMCPQCAWGQVERWLTKQKARLLACDHDHVILTMPHECNDLWLANVEGMSTRLFASVHDTLLELLGDEKYLGAKPGIIATLHTWSQTLLLHPHLHGLVTGGGLSEAGQWVAVRNGFLLPMRVVMAVFRGKLLAAIRQGVHQGQLTPPPGKSRQQVEHLLNKLGRQKWNVPIRERYPYGHGVLIYLARYLRGGPIANRRLLSWAGQQVVFGYTERAKGSRGQATRRTMRLSLEQFLGRWQLHVPPRHAVLVRCWGLYGHTQGEALAQCRQHMGQGPVEALPPRDGLREGDAWDHPPPEYCPVCGQRLVCAPLLPWAGAPRRPHRDGRRGHKGENSRGRLGADPQGRALACTGTTGAVCVSGRSMSSQTPIAGEADRPPGMRRQPPYGPTPGRDQGPISRGQEPLTAHAGRGQSNQALKRTAASSGVPLSTGLAAA